MPNINIIVPEEARNLMEQFRAEQRAEEASRAAAKQPRFEKGTTPETRTQWTTQSMEKYACGLGLIIETTGGKHSKHIVTPGGEFIASLPNHPGNLPTGTARGILKVLRWYNSNT